MSRILVAFDRWLARTPTGRLDLALFRILFAAFLLLNPRRAEFALALPEIAWDPPWGPFRLLDAPPPEWLLTAVSALVALAAALLLVGLFTRTSSLAVAFLQLFLYGVTYSYGKIDHTILVLLAPALLAWSGWGDRWSIDALRGHLPERHGWAQRLLAIAIGLGFLTAAIPKIRGGWLDLETQATRGHFLAQWFHGRDTDFGPLLYAADWPIAWEVLDLATVAIELGLLAAALNWRAFRLALAVATLFHLGVLITLDIAFYSNVLVYGAFVSWTAVLAIGQRATLPRWVSRAARAGWPVALLVVVSAAGSWLLGTLAPNLLASAMNRTLIVAAAAGGLAYLVATAWDVATALRRRRVRP